MTNILTETLPQRVKTNNGIYEPDTDYRAGIKFEIMVENGENDVFKLLEPYYPNGVPENIDEAATAAIWFYQCGEEETNEKTTTTRKKRAYSFAVDAESIYADFSRYYNIDLANTNLHWWKFRALLMGLPNDSAFKERIYYRMCDTKGLPKKEQKRILEIRKQIEIKITSEKENISLEQRNSEMIAYIVKRQKETKGVQ